MKALLLILCFIIIMIITNHEFRETRANALIGCTKTDLVAMVVGRAKPMPIFDCGEKG